MLMKTSVDNPQLLLTLTCPERAGIVDAVSRFVLGHGVDIIDNRQFGDRRAGRSFMRMNFATGPPTSRETTRTAIPSPTALTTRAERRP
jgi:formyltetrahydrofolate deformylase